MQKTRSSVWMLLLVAYCFFTSSLSCSSSSQTNTNANQNPNTVVAEIPGVQVSFDIQGSWNAPTSFFSFPWPSLLRNTRENRPDWTGFPNPKDNALVKNLLSIVGQQPGYSVSPVAYFRWNAPLSGRSIDDVILPAATSPILLLDVDPRSTERGSTFPVVATVLPSGTYVPNHLLAVSVVPGVVLRPNRLYAFVVMRSLRDQAGQLLGVPQVLQQLKAGQIPDGEKGAQLRDMYEPLWATMRQQSYKIEDVAAATVFRTGDVVADLASTAVAVSKIYTPILKNIRVDRQKDHPLYCTLVADIEQPQFQQGTPPFPDRGLFQFNEQGLPQEQGKISIPVVISLPKTPMPSDGYPLLIFLHGSGGRSTDVVDRGRVTIPGGERTKGDGPARVLAPYGIATAASALPINPERVKGAQPRAYLNLGNLAAYRDTFRQGTLETVLLVDALLRLRISPALLEGCAGPRLPTGSTEFRISPQHIAVMGQSMGSQYAAMLSAIDPRIRAVIPSGAGGHWSFFILNSGNELLQPSLLQTLLDSQESLLFVHPVLHLLHTAWEPADPLAFAARVGHDSLPSHPARSIFLPMGQSDSFFPEPILDIMALAYHTQQTGSEIWPGTQKLFSTLGNQGLLPYPIQQNRMPLSDKNSKFTSVTVQYKPDDITKEGHYIAFQLDDVRYQYACFLDTLFRTGVARVLAPKPPDQPCP